MIRLAPVGRLPLSHHSISERGRGGGRLARISSSSSSAGSTPRSSRSASASERIGLAARAEIGDQPGRAGRGRRPSSSASRRPVRTRDDLPLPEVPSTARKRVAAERVDHLVDAALAAEEQIELFPGEGPEAGIGHAPVPRSPVMTARSNTTFRLFRADSPRAVDLLDSGRDRCRPAASAAAGN